MGLVLALPGTTAAQSSDTEQTWRIDALRAGYCIEFLIDSSAADEELSDDFVPVRADAAGDLHPAVAATVAARPDSFGSWSPSQLCLYWARTVNVDGREISEDEDELLAVGVWSILARNVDSAGAAPQSRAVMLLASNWRAGRLAEREHIEFDRMDASGGKAPVEGPDGRMVPGPEDRYQIEKGNTVITWDGRLIGDSAAPGTPVSREWRAEGRRQTHWTVRGSVQPARSRPVAGALRVSGKDGLAKALKASPIRFIGAWHTGGTAELVFAR